MLRLAAIAILTTALAQGVALAQDKNKKDMSSAERNKATATQSAQNLPQTLKDKLKQNGYSDVRIIPGSFFVAAKNKDGDPVRMVIEPDSITVVTIAGSSGTTGSSGGMDQQDGQAGQSSDRSNSDQSN